MRRKKPLEIDLANQQHVRFSRLGELNDPGKMESLMKDIANDRVAILKAGVDPSLLDRFSDHTMVMSNYIGRLTGFEHGWAIGRHLLSGEEEKLAMKIAANPKLDNRELCKRLDRSKIPLPSAYAKEVRARGQSPSWEMAFMLKPPVHAFETQLDQIRIRAREMSHASGFYRKHVQPVRKVYRMSGKTPV
jgi:hypothetical protein